MTNESDVYYVQVDDNEMVFDAHGFTGEFEEPSLIDASCLEDAKQIAEHEVNVARIEGTGTAVSIMKMVPDWSDWSIEDAEWAMSPDGDGPDAWTSVCVARWSTCGE